MSSSSCTATLTLKDEAKSYVCIERGKNHTRHVFDLGLGGRREYELKAVAPGQVASFLARWLEI